MDAFVAMADPTRRRIIEALSAGERPFGELAQQFEMSAPAVSQHLKVLREAGVVRVRKHAQRRIYRLDEAGLREISDWLGRVQGFWAARLDQLEQELRKEEDNDE